MRLITVILAATASKSEINEVPSYIEKQWDTFISNFGLFATLIAIGGIALKIWFDFIFKKKLAKAQIDFNEIVQTKLEFLKLDHQKLLLTFEKFNSQQSEKYPQLYYLIEHALGHISYLRGLQSFPTFKDAAVEDVQTYCEEIEMNQGDIKRIKILWEQDKDYAIKEIRRIKNVIDYNRAEFKWYEANDYLIYNELYFSEEVTIQSRKLLSLMRKYWINLDPEYHQAIFRDDLNIMRKENVVTKNEIDEQKIIWKSLVKKEFSGQHFK